MALRGRSLSGVVLDEAAFMDAEVWFEVIRPALADKQGWALFISTPDGTASWFYDLWCYCEDDPTNEWKRWCYTTIEGGNVPADEVEAARAQLDPRTFRQEFEASFENLTGLVAISFSDDNISTDAKDISIQPLLLGVDFNVDPMSGICAVKDADTLYVFDEIMLTGGATTWDFAEEVTRRYGVDRRVIACPDPTGGARKTSGVGVTDHAILRRSGFTVQSPRSPWKIRDKITAVNTGLMDASGARRVKIHPRCKELIKSSEPSPTPLERAYLTKILGWTTHSTPSGILCSSSSTWPSLRPWELRHTACIKDVSSAQRAPLPEMRIRGIKGTGTLHVTGGGLCA